MRLRLRYGVGLCVVGLVACGGADASPEEERALEGTTPAFESAEADRPATGATPVAAPAPAPIAAPETDIEKEKAWAEARGVTFEPGKVTVVAKRRGADARSEQYDDEILVFRADGALERFVATTKPAQMPTPGSSVVPDVNGDGRKDLGVARPGIYVAKGNEWFGLEGYERRAFRIQTKDGSGYLPAWRDTSGDGVFSAKEKQEAESKNYRISGVLIHYGFAPGGTTLGKATYVGPWSVGCQNVPYGDLDRFVAAVGGAAATFTYAILQD